MKKTDRLPEAELEVMLALWHSEKPMTAGEITQELSDKRGWKSATAHVLLERLSERGYVSVDKSGHKHPYSPLVSEEKYRAEEEKLMADRYFGGSVKDMIASLLESDSLTAKDCTELCDIISRKKSELK